LGSCEGFDLPDSLTSRNKPPSGPQERGDEKEPPRDVEPKPVPA
jgi:hypothetical protein